MELLGTEQRKIANDMDFSEITLFSQESVEWRAQDGGIEVRLSCLECPWMI